MNTISKMNIMRFRKIFILIIVSLSSLVGYALAEDRVLFHISPGSIPYYNEGKIFTTWNPRSNPEIHEPGLKIFFFGKAEGCNPELKNGPVRIIKPLPNMSQDTGISVEERAKAFIPVPDESSCISKGIPEKSGSFVIINESPLTGGIGIFTASGSDVKGTPYFFQTRDEKGVGGGVNRFEKSTAVTWKIQKETIFPFRNGNSLKIHAVSSVNSLPSILDSRELPVQIRQQIEIGFANKECLIQKQNDRILCLNKFVFDFLVKRWGEKLIDDQRGCLIFVDRGQGGLSHISCYSKSKGTKLAEKKSSLNLVTSCGEGLMQTVFEDRVFCYTITWSQFLNSISAIASNHLNKPIQQIKDGDLKKLFGDSYNRPEAWYITVISFQQELHDPYRDRNVYIGGNLKEIKIISY